MAAGNFIPDKVQRALWLYIKQSNPSSIPNDHIYRGIRNVLKAADEAEEDTQIRPSVTCVCQSASVLDGDIDSINWIADASVEIRSAADDSTQDDHFTRSQEIIDLIAKDDVENDLSTAEPDFTVFLVLPQRVSWRIEGRSWITSYEMQIHCCGSEIA